MSTDAKNLVIVGAGAHSKVVADCAERAGSFQIIAFVDETREDGEWLDYPLLKEPPESENDYFIVAIGDNQVRQRKFTQMIARGFSPAKVVHPTAIIARSAEIGEGTLVCAGAIISPAAVIGMNCIINSGAIVEHDCIIGDHVHVASGCQLAGAVELGEGVFLGIGSTVIPKCKVGAWAVSGAGAVVIGDIEKDITVIGVPAKKLAKKT